MTQDDLIAAFAAVPTFKQVESVKTPVPMFVRAMSVEESDEYELLYYGPKGDKPDPKKWKTTYLLFTLADEQGNRLFKTPEDAKKIAALPGHILGAVFLEARKFNGHAPDVEKKSDSADGGESGFVTPSA